MSDAGSLPVIALCGSLRFRDELARLDAELTLAGHVVLAPKAPEHFRELTDDERERLGAVHLRRIEMADEVLVVNLGGYVGESTSREIDHARSCGVEVRFLEPADEVL